MQKGHSKSSIHEHRKLILLFQFCIKHKTSQFVLSRSSMASMAFCCYQHNMLCHGIGSFMKRNIYVTIQSQSGDDDGIKSRNVAVAHNHITTDQHKRSNARRCQTTCQHYSTRLNHRQRDILVHHANSPP